MNRALTVDDHFLSVPSDISAPEFSFRETTDRFLMAMKIAEGMCCAPLLPEHLRFQRVDGKYKPLSPEQVKANCLLIVNQALLWEIDPFAMLGSTYVVKGKLGYNGALVAAVINKSKAVKTRLSYSFDGEGDDRAVTVSAVLAGETHPRSVRISVGQAKTENEIWIRDPDQKLVYTGSIRWARRHCPEVLLGFESEDDLEQAAAEPPAIHTDPIDDQGNQDAGAELRDEWLDRINKAMTRDELQSVVSQMDAVGIPGEIAAELKEIARRIYNQMGSETPLGVVEEFVARIGNMKDPDLIRSVLGDLVADDSVSDSDLEAAQAAADDRIAALAG